MLNEKEQFKQAIEAARHVLVLFDRNENTDALGAALALADFLEKDHKSVDIICDNFVASKNLEFLEGIKKIKPGLDHIQKFVIKVDVSQTKIDSISYDVKDDWLSIYLTPKQGMLTKNELRTAQSSYKYDLIITLNTPELEMFGGIFLNNTDLFYRTTIINIDYRSDNERYGQINYIDPNVTSVSEIIYQLSKIWYEPNLNSLNATALLAGMIAATHSFKTTNVTPLTLQAAGELINHGADREKIIHHLYRTRSLSTLKLWGTALMRLKIDTAKHFAWTFLTREDFINAGANHAQLKDLITELIDNSPEVDMTLLIYEDEIHGEKIINGILHSKKGHDTLQILKPYNPSGLRHRATFTIKNIGIAEAEKNIIEEIKKSLN